MKIIADLHLHSRFALATSPRLTVESLARGALRKGIDLIAAPDFTHPTWRDELQDALTETQIGSGIYVAQGASFMLTTELSCVWRQDGKARRVHLLLTAPSFETVDKICETLSKVQRLESDGRPTLKLSAHDVLRIAKDADPRCQIIPAHAFTPWYGIFGTKTGFDSLVEVFGEDADQVRAVESGLSADPDMMHQIPDCANRAVVSFSDAHSTPNIAREATVLDISEMSYDAVTDAITKRRIVETLEWYPQHGKYHLDGHRKCGIRFTPEESRSHNNTCPVCDKPLTLGVLHRSQVLAAKARVNPKIERESSPSQPFRHIIPLSEIISHTLQSKPNTEKSTSFYDHLIHLFGSELNILLNASHQDLTRIPPYKPGGFIVGTAFAEAVLAARAGNVTIEAGYDGVYGSAMLATEPMVRYSSGYGTYPNTTQTSETTSLGT